MSDRYPLVPLGEILQPVSRPEPVDPGKTYRLLGAHWYAEGLYIKEIKPGAQIRAGKLYRVEEGDFVYNRLFAWKGSFAVASADDDRCYVSAEFPCFAVNRGCADPKYIWLYFKRQAAWAEALGLSSGSTPTSRNRLKEDKLLAMAIPLPPLPEQRRIVARIEALAARIEEARGLRRQASQGVVALRNSLLSAMVSDHVAENPLGALVDSSRPLSYGVLVPGPNVENGVPLVRVQDLDTSSPPVLPSKSIDPTVDAQYNRTRLQGGEILLGLVGSIGKVGVAPPSWAGANIARAVARIAPGPSIDRDYLLLVLQSSALQQYFVDATRTLAQPTLNISQLEEAPIPLPSIAEQRRIVARLGQLQSGLDVMVTAQAETAAELDALLPAVLDKAFNGEL